MEHESGGPTEITGSSECVNDDDIGGQWFSLEEVDGSQYVVARAKTQADEKMVSEVLLLRVMGVGGVCACFAVGVGIGAIGGRLIGIGGGIAMGNMMNEKRQNWHYRV